MTPVLAKVTAMEKRGDQYQVIVQITRKYRGSFNTLIFGEIKPYSGLNLPRFDGHGNSKKERGPDGSKKERAPSVYGAIQKPGSGDGDPQRQECGADSARAWMQRSESAWMEEGVFEGTAAGAN